MLLQVGNWFLMLSQKVKLQKHHGTVGFVSKVDTDVSIDSQLNSKKHPSTGKFGTSHDFLPICHYFSQL